MNNESPPEPQPAASSTGDPTLPHRYSGNRSQETCWVGWHHGSGMCGKPEEDPIHASDAAEQKARDELEYRIRTAAALALGGHPITAEVDAGKARITAIMRSALRAGVPSREDLRAVIVQTLNYVSLFDDADDRLIDDLPDVILSVWGQGDLDPRPAKGTPQ